LRSQQSYYRWRKEYGGLELDQAKRMKELQRENVRLKRLVADLSMTFRETVLLPNTLDCLAAPLGAYKFPEATSLSTCFSSARSATRRFRRTFSRCSSFIRLA
jgi:hypothetical protein